MEVNTGDIHIYYQQTNLHMYNQLWAQDQRLSLQPMAVKLHIYSGKQLIVKGVITIEVQYNGHTESIPYCS